VGVSTELLQTICRWNAKVEKAGCGNQHEEHPKSGSPEVGWQLTNSLSPEEPFGIDVPEAANHQWRGSSSLNVNVPAAW
jgi:hypothetical protein